MERPLVVGAGWAGLLSAEALSLQGKNPLVLEGSDRVGGLLGTTHVEGRLLEHAAHGIFLDPQGRSPLDPLPLLRRVGAQVVEASGAARERWVVLGGRLQKIPSHPFELVASDLLSFREKIRLVGEPWVKRKEEEESLEEFLSRRLGRAGGLLSDLLATGVYGGDPRRLSSIYSFPTLKRWENEGSILKGAFRRGGVRRVLMAPLEGMEDLVRRISHRHEIRRNERVLSVTPEGKGFRVRTSKSTYETRLLVLASGPEGWRAWDEKSPEVPSAPLRSIGLSFSSKTTPPLGFGILSVGRERRSFLGVIFESDLFPGRAPPGERFLRVLVGGSRTPDLASKEDIVPRVVEDLKELGVVREDPCAVIRGPLLRIPQIEVGHSRVLQWAKKVEEENPGLVLVGAGVRDVSLYGILEEVKEKLLGGSSGTPEEGDRPPSP